MTKILRNNERLGVKIVDMIHNILNDISGKYTLAQKVEASTIRNLLFNGIVFEDYLKRRCKK